MKTQEKKGLWALLGLGAGLFAWWKYRNLTPTQKEELHNKVKDVGTKINNTVNDLDAQASRKFTELKDSATKGVKDMTDGVKDMTNKDMTS